MLPSMPSDKRSALLKVLEAERQQRQRRNRLRHYRPYPKQAEFHQHQMEPQPRMTVEQIGDFGESVADPVADDQQEERTRSQAPTDSVHEVSLS